MFQRRYGLLLIFIVLLCDFTPLAHAAQDKKENVWSLYETNIYYFPNLPGVPQEQTKAKANEWVELYSHESGDSKGFVDLNNGLAKFETNVHVTKPTINYQFTVITDFDPLPTELIPGETVNIEVSVKLTSGNFGIWSHEAWFVMKKRYGDIHLLSPEASVRPLIVNGETYESATMTFVVPELSETEINFSLQTAGFYIEWFYRVEEQRIPVIFIPGTGGSYLYADGSELWPKHNLINDDSFKLKLDSTGLAFQVIKAPDIIKSVLTEEIYGPFIESMDSWGYDIDKNMFIFPYDWRLDNNMHIEYLDQKIDSVLLSTGQKHVILIAHSMGGIIARLYMLEKGTDKIDRVITMGTPHLGSVKPYYAYLSGYNFDNNFYQKGLMKIICQNWPSGYQLFPWKPFIKDGYRAWSLEESFSVNYHSAGWSYDLKGTKYYDHNDWEWELNQDLVTRAKAFRNRLGTNVPLDVPIYTIIGQGKATLSSFTAREPEWYEPYTGIKKADGSRWVLEPDLDWDFGDGDGTVPLWSAKGLNGDLEYFIQDSPSDSAEHMVLGNNKKVQALIKEIIIGTSDVSKFPERVFFNPGGDMTGFEIHSSANLHIYDSLGNHLGVNEYGSIDESIPGGSMISMDGYEYCSILSPYDSYQVEVVGFEEGNFTLDMVVHSNGKVYEFSYPEIDVVNGSVASLSLPDYELAVVDPPEILLQGQESVLSFAPEVVEVQLPVEDTISKTENAINDVIEGIPGFPVWSIGITLLVISILLRKEILSKQF